MKGDEGNGNRIDAVRERLSQAAKAAASTEEREQINAPLPETKSESDLRQNHRFAMVFVFVASVVILGIVYFVCVQLMFPKFEGAPAPSPEVVRRNKERTRRELERILNESNAQNPVPPSVPSEHGASPTPSKP